MNMSQQVEVVSSAVKGDVPTSPSEISTATCIKQVVRWCANLGVMKSALKEDESQWREYLCVDHLHLLALDQYFKLHDQEKGGGSTDEVESQ